MNPTAGATSVYLIRHGRTALNAAGVLRGRLDPPLDPMGQDQAIALGELFCAVSLRAVVTSPLRRAVETARPIAAATGAHVVVEAALADRDYGPWAGRTAEEVRSRFGSLDKAPGVEPLDELERRVIEAVAGIGRRWSPGQVAVVAHDVVNRHAIALLTGWPFTDVSQRTGCWNRLEVRADHWVASIVNALPDEPLDP